MKIVCAGFWKTGTKSLAEALKVLGYKVYDYDDQYMLLCQLWNKFFDGTVTDEEIRKSLKDVDVLIDGPVIAFWEEIYKAIPGTKVILTSRNEDSWFESFKGQHEKVSVLLRYAFLAMYLTPTGFGFIRNAMRVVKMCLGVEGPFNISIFNMYNPRLYKNQYRKHNCHVIQSVPENNLLIYKAGDGWEPLCKFLGKEIPEDVPYPHLNKEGAHFKDEGPQNPALKRAMVEVIILISVLFCLIVYCVSTFFI